MGNMKLPNPKQAPHVSQKKDSMAKNVGGSAHMRQTSMDMPKQNVKKSGGKIGKGKMK